MGGARGEGAGRQLPPPCPCPLQLPPRKKLMVDPATSVQCTQQLNKADIWPLHKKLLPTVPWPLPPPQLQISSAAHAVQFKNPQFLYYSLQHIMSSWQVLSSRLTRLQPTAPNFYSARFLCRAPLHLPDSCNNYHQISDQNFVITNTLAETLLGND